MGKLKLPEKKSEIEKRYAMQKFGMIGSSGIGKSEFWTQDPNAFFIETEAGLNAYEVFKLPARDWGELSEVCSALLERVGDGEEFPYSVVVVDTIDRVVDYAEDDTIAKAQEFYKGGADIQSIGDVPNGAGWYQRTNKISRFLTFLETLPCAVAFIGHLAQKSIKPDIGKEYTKDTISIGAKLGEQLLAWTDHTLHVKAVMKGDTLHRTVFTLPTQSREAKSRGGLVPDNWKWEADSSVNYKHFRGLFA